MSLVTDLATVRDAISAGADWLDAMMAVDGVAHGSKRFIRMYQALSTSGPRRTNSLSLTDFFLRMHKDDVVQFFDDVIAQDPIEIDFPVWPLLGIGKRATP